MKATTAVCLAIAAAAFAGPANAIFKCTTAKGVVYQDRPCRDGTEKDLTIVVPTGEVAPTASAATDELPNTRRSQRNAGDPPATTAKAAEQRPSDSAVNAADTQRRKDTSAGAETKAPMTADQARKTDPTAKYFATEAFGSGGETPTQMNCESPSGEKRVFYLTNGKLTSI